MKPVAKAADARGMLLAIAAPMLAIVTLSAGFAIELAGLLDIV